MQVCSFFLSQLHLCHNLSPPSFIKLETLSNYCRLCTIEQIFFGYGKKTHCGRSTLFRSQATGGLGVPHLWQYYLAARLTPLAQLHATSNNILWLFEFSSILPFFFPGLLWSKVLCSAQFKPINLMVAQSLLLWYPLSIILSKLPLASYIGDPLFSLAFKRRNDVYIYVYNWIHLHYTVLHNFQPQDSQPLNHCLKFTLTFPGSLQILSNQNFFPQLLCLMPHPNLTLHLNSVAWVTLDIRELFFFNSKSILLK